MSNTKKIASSLHTLLRRRPLFATTRRFPPPYSVYSATFANSRIFSATARHYSPVNFPQISWRNFSSGPASIDKPSDGRCWGCNAEPETVPFLVCKSCPAIQPVDPSDDYFQIFGLEKKYEIEEGSLEGKYKDWQKKLHPDLVHSKSEKERDFAAAQSARVIDAYRTLNNPRLRAIYILKLEGVDVDEEETISDPELLAEVMEIREAVEEAPDMAALNNIRSLMHEKLQHWYNSFANAFQGREFEEAITCIRRMTYYDRVNEEIVKRL